MERKLPLIIGGLLLAAIVATTAISFVEVRQTAMAIAAERLGGARDQLRSSLQQSAATMRTIATAAAARPAVAEFAASRTSADRARALDALAQPGAQPETFLGAELRDGQGRVVLSTVPERFATAGLPVGDVLPRTEPEGQPVVGAFRLLRDTVIFPIAAPVPGVPDLYVVRWRRLGTASAARSREVLANLIGADASLSIGNADGSRWTDFERPTGGPALPAGVVSTDSGLHRYSRDGAEYLASVAPIGGTPWLLAVDFPAARVMAPVRDFARRNAMVAGVVLLAGLLAAWLISRRITRPLGALTHAADRMADGDLAQRVDIVTGDELETLGRAFTHMADELRRSRDELEARVAARTQDLNTALTQLHDTQEALVRRERLAMLGQLSSGIGHELRNPLGVMTNAVYYLKTVLAASPGTVIEYLDIISQQIALSEKIVGDLLDFARQKPPQRKAIPLASTLDSQRERLGNCDGVTVTLDVPESIPDVLVDPVHFGQIALNLLTNAVQAMDGMGNGRVEVVARPAGDAVELEFRDTGPGVQPMHVEKIFEPLFTTKARGIGLGLAVSRMLARANGGELALVESVGASGGGATFRLTLPIAAPAGAGVLPTLSREAVAT